jgi:hypothetical protein
MSVDVETGVAVVRDFSCVAPRGDADGAIVDLVCGGGLPNLRGPRDGDPIVGRSSDRKAAPPGAARAGSAGPCDDAREEMRSHRRVPWSRPSHTARRGSGQTDGCRCGRSRRIQMRALADLDDALVCLHSTLDDLDRRVTCLKRVMYGWGLILTAEVLLLTGVVLWWGR